jgi:hypothetical protein
MTAPTPPQGEGTCSNCGQGPEPAEIHDRVTLSEKWLSASEAARKAEHHFPADCLAEAVQVLRQEKAERERAERNWRIENEWRSNAEADVERLARWKAEALPVLNGLQELGKALELPLGAQVTGPQALAEVERLRAVVAKVEALADEWVKGRVRAPYIGNVGHVLRAALATATEQAGTGAQDERPSCGYCAGEGPCCRDSRPQHEQGEEGGR